MKINPAPIPQPHSPAKAARELLQSHPELEGQPFGRIVSKIARGQDPAPAAMDAVLQNR